MLPCSSKSIHKDDDCMRYVDCAVMYMSDYFTEKGIPRDKTEVKLFGGSDMFSYQGEAPTVGLKNIEAAVNILSKLNYKILSKDVGGQFTRKLYFSTESGTVYVRKISRLQGM
jgi:chemotaxis protein CheD